LWYLAPSPLSRLAFASARPHHHHHLIRTTAPPPPIPHHCRFTRRA
jgi:hypothetical protein